MPKQTFLNLDKNKRQRIEKCAMEEFEHYIYANASINRVVKNSGIAKGSFYQYFEDKMDLAIHILTIIAEKETDHINKFMPEMELLEDDFFSWVKKQVEISIEFGLENMQYIMVYRNLMASNELILQNKITEVATTMGAEFYREKIELHIKKGNLRNDISSKFLAEYLMMIIFSVIDGLLKKVSIDEEIDRKEIMNLVDQVLNLTENGLKKQGGMDVRNEC